MTPAVDSQTKVKSLAFPVQRQSRKVAQHLRAESNVRLTTAVGVRSRGNFTKNDQVPDTAQNSEEVLSFDPTQLSTEVVTAPEPLKRATQARANKTHCIADAAIRSC